MNFTLFIARRLMKGSKDQGRLSRPIVNIAVGSIILGMAVMILTIFIVKAFQKEVRDRTIAFGAHVQIVKAVNNNSAEPLPIKADQPVIEELRNDPRIAHVQQFMTKNAIIKTKTENEGVVVKGVGEGYNWGFIGEHMHSGNTFNADSASTTYPILISKMISDRLGLEAGNKTTLYFIVSDTMLSIKGKDIDTTLRLQDKNATALIENAGGPEADTSLFIKTEPRARNFTVSGVYETGLEDFDKKMVFTSIHALKKICRWNDDLTGGFELYVQNFEDVDALGEEIFEQLDYSLTSYTVKQANPGIFDWLSMHDTTAWIVLILMVIVAVINMISALIILIIEKVNMIGVLKALGMSNQSVMKIFISQAAFLILKGIFWGNVLGLVIAFLQWKFQLVKLDQTTYYVSSVPIHFEWIYLLLLNVATFTICMFFMVFPALIIAKTSPIKAIRFN